MRWIAGDVFRAGEPNPFPADVAAVRRRMRAVPVDPSPARTWLVDVRYLRWAPVRRLYRRRRGAVIGQAWVRRRSLRWRRAAWGLWALLLALAVVDLAVRGATDERVVRDFGGELCVLIAAALLLTMVRVKAVIDPADDTVGIRS